MSYIGSTPTTQNFIAGTDQFTGNGSTTNWTLSRFVNSTNDIEVVIANVVQNPTSYSVSGNTLTISPAVGNGTAFYVRYLTTTLQSVGVSDGAITTPKLADSAVTTAKVADAAVTTPKIADAAVTSAKLTAGAPTWDASGNTTIYGALRSNSTSPPTFQNSGGTQIGTLCRAWASFTPSTGAIRGSFNVSSVTRNGSGDYTANYTNALPDVNYATVATSNQYNNGQSITVGIHTSSTTSVRIQSGIGNSASYVEGTISGGSTPIVNCAVFR